MSNLPEEISEIDHVYPIRIAEPAIHDIEDAHLRFKELTGSDHADEWKDGLFDRIRTLATMPRKHPVALESARFGFEVRELTYRLRRGVAYRVLFRIVDPPWMEQVDGRVHPASTDPAYVRILHVRHGARKPMTKREASAQLAGIEHSAGA